MCKNSWLKLLKFLDSREYNSFEGLACGSIVSLLLVSLAVFQLKNRIKVLMY